MLTKEQIRNKLKVDPFWELPDDALMDEWDWYDEIIDKTEKEQEESSAAKKEEKSEEAEKSKFDEDDVSWSDDEDDDNYI